MIYFCNVLLCLYICIIRVTFSRSCSCKDNNKCLSGTWSFGKSITYFSLSTIKRPTNTWSSNLSSKQLLWSPFYINILFWTIFKWRWSDFELAATFFLLALCVALSSSLYFPPLSQPNINLLLLPLSHVFVPEGLMIKLILCLILASLIHLITHSPVSNLCVVENTLMISTHIWFFYHLLIKEPSYMWNIIKKIQKYMHTSLLVGKLSSEQT